MLGFVSIRSRIPVHGMVQSSLSMDSGTHAHTDAVALESMALSRFKGITRHLVKLFNSSHGTTTNSLLVMIQG